MSNSFDQQVVDYELGQQLGRKFANECLIDRMKDAISELRKAGIGENYLEGFVDGINEVVDDLQLVNFNE